MINSEPQGKAQVTPEMFVLAARLYAEKSQRPVLGDWSNKGMEVQIPSDFIEEALEKIQAKQIEVQAHCKKVTIALASVVLAVSSWGIITESYLAGSVQKVDAAWAGVENQLHQSVEIIPQLLKVLQADAQQQGQHQDLINSLRKARASYLDARTPEAKIAATQQVSQAIDNYKSYLLKNPQLESQKQLTKLRSTLLSSRKSIISESRRYNEAAQSYNQKLKLFPNSLIVAVAGFQQKPFLGVATTETPKIN